MNQTGSLMGVDFEFDFLIEVTEPVGDDPGSAPEFIVHQVWASALDGGPVTTVTGARAQSLIERFERELSENIQANSYFFRS